jgi:HNH endonuclease
LTTRELLRASHIKPWATSSDRERLDPENGLLLSAHLDVLFDSFLISFSDNAEILISDRINVEDSRILKLKDFKLSKPPSKKMKTFLAFHRGEARLATEGLAPTNAPQTPTTAPVDRVEI